MVHSGSELCGAVPLFFPAQSRSEKAVTEVGIRRKPEAKRKGRENFNVAGRAGHKEFVTEGSER